MPVITPLKANIRTEETKETAAVSSAVAQKIGGAVNFLSERIDEKITWKINSKFGSNTGAGTDYIDGAFLLSADMEIVFFGAYIETAGTTYNTVINIDRFTSNGSGSNIFTASPRFEPTAPANAYMSVRYNPDETFENPTGSVLPTFITRDIDKGDMLLFKLGSRGSGARNITVTLGLRAR
jgi:hypothetical protein